MPSNNPAQRLRDIVENIDAIREFTAAMDANDLADDRKTLYAVVRALEIISEATRRLPAELKQRRPDVDRGAIAAAGNVYRHEYEGVDISLVWHTIQYDLTELQKIATEEFDRLRED